MEFASFWAEIVASASLLLVAVFLGVRSIRALRADSLVPVTRKRRPSRAVSEESTVKLLVDDPHRETTPAERCVNDEWLRMVLPPNKTRQTRAHVSRMRGVRKVRPEVPAPTPPSERYGSEPADDLRDDELEDERSPHYLVRCACGEVRGELVVRGESPPWAPCPQCGAPLRFIVKMRKSVQWPPRTAQEVVA